MEDFLIALDWAAPPVIGAFIGYWTNRIAIKMRFRPLQHKHVGPIPVPLTPGVIPRNHDKLADSIGELVAQELLTRETIENLFADPTTRDELRSFIRQQIPSPLRRINLNWFADRIVTFFAEKAPDLSEVMDVQKHVTNRIKGFEVAHVEQVILAVTGAHLKKLAWFGALLGALLGCLQSALNAF